jgi:predicted dehydrogenase
MVVETPDASEPGSEGFAHLGAVETRQFLRALAAGTEPVVLPEQACVVTEVLEAIYASAESGRTITF